MDAFAAAAVELLGGAAPHGWSEARATRPGKLVRTVGAVGVSVTHPETGHAQGVVAAEGDGAAGGGRAGRFVTAVVAVGIIVTHEGRGHALATGTSELVVGALLWGWQSETVWKRIKMQIEVDEITAT